MEFLMNRALISILAQRSLYLPTSDMAGHETRQAVVDRLGHEMVEYVDDHNEAPSVFLRGNG